MTDAPGYGELQIDVAAEPPQTLVRVGGEVDLSNAARLAEAIESASGEDAILVELSGLEFIDSTGLSVLLDAAKRSREHGRKLRVRGARGQVRRVLEVAGVHDWLLQDDSPTGAD